MTESKRTTVHLVGGPFDGGTQQETSGMLVGVLLWGHGAPKRWLNTSYRRAEWDEESSRWVRIHNSTWLPSEEED